LAEKNKASAKPQNVNAASGINAEGEERSTESTEYETSEAVNFWEATKASACAEKAEIGIYLLLSTHA
jgi:hypothetical protein